MITTDDHSGLQNLPLGRLAHCDRTPWEPFDVAWRQRREAGCEEECALEEADGSGDKYNGPQRSHGRRHDRGHHATSRAEQVSRALLEVGSNRK